MNGFPHFIRNVLVTLILCEALLPAGAFAGLKPVGPSGVDKPPRSILSIVIGNANYVELPRLTNSVNDADTIARLFQDLKHEVIVITDATKRSFAKTIGEARSRIDRHDMIVFYYAGHGVSIQGENYMLPTDFVCGRSRPCDATVFKREAFSMRAILADLQQDDKILVAIFDACRDDPFGLPGGGLGAFDTSEANTFLAYATAPGAVALDGWGSNSPFTDALARALSSNPEADLESTFRRVRSSVVQTTNGMQVPFTVSSLSTEVALKTDGLTPAPEPDSPSQPAEPPPTGEPVEPAPPAERPEPEAKPASSQISKRLDGLIAFDELGPRPGKNALTAWLRDYEGVPGLESKAEEAYERLESLISPLIVEEPVAAPAIEVAGLSEKGGSEPRNITPPENSPLGRTGRRIAILVGINDYEHLPSKPTVTETLSDLRFAENDAGAFHRLLQTGRMGRG